MDLQISKYCGFLFQIARNDSRVSFVILVKGCSSLVGETHRLRYVVYFPTRFIIKRVGSSPSIAFNLLQRCPLTESALRQDQVE